jgi:hypothetical protein
MSQSKLIFIVGLGMITIWDITTTIIGTNNILGNTDISFFLSIIFTVMLMQYLIQTIPIMFNQKEDLLHIGAKILWILAILSHIFTSFIGHKKLIESGDSSFDLAQIVITIGMTLFVSSAPIIISYLIYIPDEDE